MKESGYKTSADFIDYLLRGNKGRQIDGTTLKQFMEVMNEVCYELKKAVPQTCMEHILH